MKMNKCRLESNKTVNEFLAPEFASLDEAKKVWGERRVLSVLNAGIEQAYRRKAITLIRAGKNHVEELRDWAPGKVEPTQTELLLAEYEGLDDAAKIEFELGLKAKKIQANKQAQAEG